jgi:type VI protein secretion system component VasF
MSSKAKKVSQQIVAQRLTTVVQVLSIMEEEAKKKNFFARFIIAMQYLFCKKIDVFFKVGRK